MEKTKNDLDWNTVTLDYKALRETALMAVYMKLEEINKYREQMLHVLRDCREGSISLEAAWLKTSAEALQIAAETYHVLTEGEKRERVVIVNHVVKRKED